MMPRAALVGSTSAAATRARQHRTHRRSHAIAGRPLLGGSAARTLGALPCATLYPVASLVCYQWERVAAELADARAAEWSATVSKGAFECMLRSGPNPHLLQASGIWVHHTPSGSTLQLDVGTAEAAIREPRACVAHGTPTSSGASTCTTGRCSPLSSGARCASAAGSSGAAPSARGGGDLNSSDERYLRAVIAQRGASSK